MDRSSIVATTVHVPVLLEETLAALEPRPGGRYVDATLGGGGHAEAILDQSSPTGLLLGIDLDSIALERARTRLAPFGGRVTLAHASFDSLERIVRWEGFAPVNGILLDLGVSSDQLDSAERGFGFRASGPLDMRFDNRQNGRSARTLVNTQAVAELADILFRFGEEPRARSIARAIVESRGRQPILTTDELAAVVERAAGHQRGKTHPATKTFQALRIAVNGELTALESVLPQGIEILADGGRLAVITFHSLEDRIVKHYFRDEAASCVCPPGLPVCVCGKTARVRLVTRHGVRPTPVEVERNPRSRSATLRVVEKLPLDSSKKAPSR
jgi:16S rRNA (cytosine1402-N4)-methyltransferase